MDALLNWLWQGGVVAIAAMGLLRLLERTPAAVRCVLCWAGLLLVTTLPAAALVMSALRPAAPAIPSAAIVTVPSAWWTSTAAIAGAWAIWAAVCGFRLVRAIVVVRRARARVRPFQSAAAPRLMHWLRVRTTGRAARLVISDGIRAAGVFGCGEPLIAVAPGLVERLNADDLDRVIIHEWAHVQRRDDLAKLAQLLVRAIAGWHPAVWWLDRRLSSEQELACDEMVVTASGAPKAYASCLVKLASMCAPRADAMLVTGALSSGGLRRRVAHLLTRKEFVSPVWSRRAAITMVTLLFIVALGIAPLSFVEAAVSTTVARVMHPVAQAAPEAGNAIAQGTGSQRTVEARRATARPGTSGEAPDPPRRVLITQTDAPGPSGKEIDRAGESSPQPAAADAPSPGTESVAPPLVTSSPPLPVAPPPAVNAGSRPVWSSAADAGVALGRKSKNAGVATGSAFTRFAKKITGSF